MSKDSDNISVNSNKVKPIISSENLEKGELQSEEKVGVLLGEKTRAVDGLEVIAGETADYGRNDEIGGLRPHEGVKQGLNQRHIQMLALAGAIGTGIFLSSGKALVRAGPVGLLLGYISTSTVVIAMMLSLGELCALSPTSGSYIRHATMFVDQGLGFSVGWNLAVGSAVSIPGELVSCYVLIQYWTGDSLSPAIFITVFGLLILFTNLFMIRIYGEVEFVFAMIKILLIVGLIIFGICIDAGAGPSGEAIGFRFWKNPGPFEAYLVAGNLGKFLGYWSVLNTAAYSFAGVESVAMAAAETQNPRQNIPKACKRIFFRISVFYILSLFVVSLIVSSDDKGLLNSSGTASASPFVIAAKRAGITSLSSLINGVVLTSAWSSANHGILSGSRSLFGLALDGNAWKFFLKTHRLGVPYIGVSAIAIFMTLAYMTVSNSGTVVFGWFQSLTAASTLFQWITVAITYLRFYYAAKVQGIDRSTLPYRSPLQPFLGWWALGGSFIILLTGGFSVFIHGNWDIEDFFSSYFFPVFNIVCYLGFKLVKKTRIVPLSEVPIQPWLDEARNYPEDPLPKAKGWRKILYFLWN